MKILIVHPAKRRLKPAILVLLLAGCFFVKGHAQLKADFTIDNPGGCSPLIVSFINTSSGASASATYQWSFDNGNSDGYTKDAQAVYQNEGTYTVKLTVRDGSQSNTAQKNITVYKKPSASISFDQLKGCAPYPVVFNADAKAGDGTISKYVWDFGDGNVDSVSNSSTVNHTYTAAAHPPVTLTVVNSHGCYTTVDKSGPVVLPSLNADFDVSATALCTVGQTVNFTNKSSGPEPLSFTWYLGDGSTSDARNLSKSYTAKGVYDVTLIATNTEGCTDTLEKKGLINVANFTTDFTVPSVICAVADVELVNQSSPAADQTTWSIAGIGTVNHGPKLTYGFPAKGAYQLTMINTYGTCSETVTKEITVKEAPAFSNFVTDLGNACGVPSTISFKDTSDNYVSWSWDFGNGDTDNKKETSYTYNKDGAYAVQLKATDAQGCEVSFHKLITLSNPDIHITHSGDLSGCPGLKTSFGTNFPSNQMKSFEWDFGDGETSTEANPTHTFNKEGTYTISLKYTTSDGCSGNVTLLPVVIDSKPRSDFSINATEICGASPAVFTNLTTGNTSGSEWYFGDGNFAYGDNPTYYYNQAGDYTVTLITRNGSCRDTVQKTGLVKILPPFPKTQGYVPGCKSGEVTLYQDNISNLATKMWWDYGDGVVEEIDPSAQTTLHTYDSSKIYKAYLIAENGNCTVKDSITFPILQRQDPVLTASLTEICGSGDLKINISGLENNPFIPSNYYMNHYNIYGWLYADGTIAYPSVVNQSNVFITDFSATLTNLENGQSGIRVIIQPNGTGCTDTSNLVPLTIKGPKAKFSYSGNNLCFKQPVVFKDQSTPNAGVPIKDWQWDFGDREMYAHADTNYPVNGLISHLYSDPGHYNPVLTVTDEDGCIGKTEAYSNQAVVKGPKASFEYSPDKIFPGTTVFFYNTTNYANSTPQFNWRFTNGTPTYNGFTPPNKSYSSLGKDSITLIAKDPSGCTDTAIRVLYIKDVAASFSFKENYITGSSCPPVIVNFTSTSDNAQRLKWDFGTGGIDDDNRTITNHTYYKPGEYRVVLYAYGSSTRVDSAVTYITIKGPYATINADTLSGCLNQKVTLNASVKNANSFTWDFGDGSLQQTTDTFTVHSYTRAGVYTPALVLKDGSGCAGTSELPDKIVIDSLAILRLQTDPFKACDSAMVLFNPQVKSIAAEDLNMPLRYQWNYGDGSASVTNNNPGSSHFYNRPAKYEVSLSVSSPFGCVKDIEDSVVIIPTPHSKISGPASVCQDGAVLFNGSTDLPSPITWNWDFENGNQSSAQHPEAQLYTKAADPVTIRLITDNRGCADTTVHLLTVHKRPDVNITPRDPVLCLGNNIQLSAHDGNQYKWHPTPGLSQYNIAGPIATPTDNATYYVEVTNAFGCKKTDSTSVTVIKPQTISLASETFVCYGSAVQLPAGGTDLYQWIDNTVGLSNTIIDKPYASPLVSTTYTVAGYDKHRCFYDTAKIYVDVKSLPSVMAPGNMELPTGSEILLPAIGSDDVVSWDWSPSDYLSCTGCSSPVSRPRSDVSYVITAKNRFECASSDTVSIKLVCAQSLVYIPNAFTPNNDRLNDVFYIKGRGIRSIKSMRVFNRWGQVVFETANVEIDDITKGWDGAYKGRDAESDTYVYYVELICDTGEIFSRKGTVTLIR